MKLLIFIFNDKKSAILFSVFFLITKFIFFYEFHLQKKNYVNGISISRPNCDNQIRLVFK